MNRASNRNLRGIIRFSVLFACLLLCARAHAWQDKVVGVADGDYLTVLHEGKKERVRLYGIETPSPRQDFGDKAKGFTSEATSRKVVEVEPVAVDRKGRTKDQFGRTVALVTVEGGRCLNEELVRAGLAWVRPDLCAKPECKGWKSLEKQAKRAKLGLWSQPNPIPPWEFRQSKGATIPVFHGDIVKHVFHSSNCEDFDCNSCIAVFRGRDQAIKGGYGPCPVCSP